METLLALSMKTNLGYNTNDQDLFLNSAIQLFNYVLPTQRGTKVLTLLEEQTHTQMVGKAFSRFARVFDNGDSTVNSVAAENAYYCLVKSIKAGNSFAAPELFNLLDSKPEAILDKFVETIFSNMMQMQRMMQYNRYGDPHKNPIVINEAKEFVSYVKFYTISIFYDIKTNQLKISKDVFDSSLSKVLSTIEYVLSKKSYEEAITIGQTYFDRVYLENEETLLNYERKI